MSQNTIRPSFSRLAYAHAQRCQINGAACEADLISIGTHMARVRLRDDAEKLLPPITNSHLKLTFMMQGQVQGPFACRIGWMHGREAGLEFEACLNIGISALQRAFANSPYDRSDAA